MKTQLKDHGSHLKISLNTDKSGFGGGIEMLPTIEEAEKELKLAEELNPGPWIKHSINVGIAARNIARNLPNLDENKA